MTDTDGGAATDSEDVWLPLNDSNTTESRDGPGGGGSSADSSVWSSKNLRSVVVSAAAGSDSAASDVEPFSGGTASFGGDRNARMSSSDRSRDNAQSLRAIQQRLEARQALREGLVDRPLNQFAGKFIVHLLKELWNQDYYLRSGTSVQYVIS